MSMPPAAAKIVAELEAGIQAMDAEIKAAEDARVAVLTDALAQRHRIEALARSRFVIAEQLAQLKETLAADAARPPFPPGEGAEATEADEGGLTNRAPMAATAELVA